MVVTFYVYSLLLLGLSNSVHLSTVRQQTRTERGVKGEVLVRTYYRDEAEVFKIRLGASANLGQYTTCGKNCFDFKSALLNIQEIEAGWERFTWTVRDTSLTLGDCVDLRKHSWYGGPEQMEQYWPLDELRLNNFSYVTKQAGNCAVLEPYWLSSIGAYIYINETTPLFVTQNRSKSNDVCFTAEIAGPYNQRKNFTFIYDIVIKQDVKEAHKHAVKTFFGKPTGIPNAKMFEEPIFSTWAKFKRDVNTSVVDSFAKEILSNNFTGQFELDDDWEICYGALEFRKSKFEDPKAVVKKLHDQGFRVTLWAHPFINTDCEPYFSEAKKNGYLVQNVKGEVETQWWNSGTKQSSIIDFTNEKARKWWADRLLKLKNGIGFDGYKFDAGETSWLPQVPVLFDGSPDTLTSQPNAYTTEYLKTCAQFGDLVEVRSAYRTQSLPIFVRVVDKDTRWTFDNGLPTLITTVLQMNLAGYPLVLPDMIGGNLVDDDKITAELFVRWLQATVFMPSMQFSLVPWEFNDAKIDVLGIAQKYVKLHADYAPQIIALAKQSVATGAPLNAPIWWIAPNDTKTYRISDQYLLGDKILVAPVITEGAVSRDIYLPEGRWLDANTNTMWLGGRTIKNYSAPIDVLPHFILSD